MESTMGLKNVSLAVGSLGLFLAILTTLPAFRSITYHLCSRTAVDEPDDYQVTSACYHDQDDDATGESIAAFPDKWHRVVIFFLSVIGLNVTLSLATIETSHNYHGYKVELWLLLGVWTVAVLFVEPSPVCRFSLVHFIFWTSILAVIVPWTEMYLLYFNETRQYPSRVVMWLYAAQSAIATLCIAVCSLLPRRPDVYTNGQMVDRKSTVSLLGAMLMALKQYANTKLNMNSTERAIEYSRIQIEDQGGLRPPAAWPTSGRLEINDLVVGYAPDLLPVLDGLTFSAVNERVGVIGRTGTGKSTLSLALFRFLEARQGSIYIDGLDISRIKLHDLRSRLAIIPQDPVLFSGTIRSNLDPFDQHSDAEILDALERVHLIKHAEDYSSSSSSSSSYVTTADTFVTTAETWPEPDDGNDNTTNIFTSLSSTVSEGGLNFSQGQRQLLCLARAILSQPKIMILDETTSAVNMETDKLIQRSIREEFPHVSTLLVATHRLSTIADFDKILILDAGRAVGFRTPRDLMEVEGGMFRSFVERSSERELLYQIIYER